MKGKMTIELKQLRIFAYHGLYAEEKKTGNEFELNLSVSYQSTEEDIMAISATINYVSLYELVKEEMKKPADLLETLVTNIAGKIKSVFPQVKSIQIAVSKLNPPITGFVGSVCVGFQKEY